MDYQNVAKIADKENTQGISREASVPAGSVEGAAEALSRPHADEKITQEGSHGPKVPFVRISDERSGGIDTRKDINQEIDGEAIPTLKQYLEKKVMTFAQKLYTSTTSDGVASNFNTACVVLGDTNIKNRFARDKAPRDKAPEYKLFYGQNQGYKLWKNAGIQEKMSDALKNNLTTVGFENWTPKNCAEVDAIQRATSAGVNLEYAHMYTVRASNGRIVGIDACRNCTASFGSSVKNRNYSGWNRNASGDYEEFKDMLKNGQKTAALGWWCKGMPISRLDSAKRKDLEKAKASHEAINARRNIEPSHK